MAKKPKTTDIVFLREFKGQITEVPAELVGESEPRCKVCYEKEQGHSRNGARKHPFEPETGYTLIVHYPNQDLTYHNVMQGDTANCWKEKS